MPRYSLDSDIVTAILKKDEIVLAALRARLAANEEVIICPFVYYEVRRGLLDKGAQAQLEALRSFVEPLPWLEFNRDIWTAAAEGWAQAKKTGSHREDPDLLIAYHARHFGAVMVTSNARHYERFPVDVEDWRS